MRLPITLQRTGAVIPRDPNLTFRVQRAPAPAAEAPVAAAVEESVAFTIGAGADNFADATAIAYQEFRDVLADYTYNKALTTETDEPKPVTTTVWTTAWWKVTVPAGETAWLNADTQLSFAGPLLGGANTAMAVYWGSAINALTKIASNNNARSGVFYARVDAILLDGDASGDPDGTTFYIQVEDRDGDFVDDYGICYVLRVSLMLNEPSMNTIPDGQHNPEDPV